MVVEKLGFFRKIFILIGKRIAWSKAKKVNSYVAAKWCQATLEEIIDINNGNVAQGFEEFEDIIQKGSEELMSGVFLTPIVFGIKPTVPQNTKQLQRYPSSNIIAPFAVGMPILLP